MGWVRNPPVHQVAAVQRLQCEDDTGGVEARVGLGQRGAARLLQCGSMACMREQQLAAEHKSKQPAACRCRHTAARTNKHTQNSLLLHLPAPDDESNPHLQVGEQLAAEHSLQQHVDVAVILEGRRKVDQPGRVNL